MSKLLSLLVVIFGLTMSAQSIPSPQSDPKRAADLKYANRYYKDPKLSTITAYVSGEKQYLQHELDRLMQYDAVLISVDSFMHQSKRKIKTFISPFKLLNARENTRIGIKFNLHSPKEIHNVEKLNMTAAPAIEIASEYPFIDEINIALDIESIKANPNQYQQFLRNLRQTLKEVSSEAEISLTVTIPKNKQEARALQHVSIQDTSEQPMTKVYLKPRLEFEQPEIQYLHHASLITSPDRHWSIAESVEHLIYQSGFHARQLQLGYSRQAYRDYPLIEDSEQPHLAESANKQYVDNQVTRNLYTKILDVKQIEGLRNKKNSGFELITDHDFKVDYLYDSKKDNYIAIETPRSVFHTAQYVKQTNLGGLFVEDIDNDNQLLLNAAREGLGYNTERYFFAMKHVINSCGYSDRTTPCQDLHFDSNPENITELKTAEQFLEDLTTHTQVIHFDNVMTAKYLYAGFKGGLPTTGEEMGLTVTMKAFYNTEFTKEQYDKIRELHKYADYHGKNRTLHNYVAPHNTEELSASTFKGLYDIARFNRAVSEAAKESIKFSNLFKGKKNNAENSRFHLFKKNLDNPDEEARKKFMRSTDGKKFIEKFDNL
ncbi:glycoside hydrolase family 18 protein [Vibrio caribbeanicus]|uniref:GH18 domain-containing protein n=1 Tax=Vibrio caribbeanicus ATCC BAA-2122 TaxID=796620 RepID=E3BJY6_9VIBR|nr:glycosyl hydrolase family 18 protein [Vibrio caribbeanicus]EFP96614.1 hypothetical protein VIBC2010_09827 [Vibrio caribbeanicus ATCC BAA-2122]